MSERLMDRLEPRRLLHAELSLNVHFQPEGTPRVHGYETDFGYAYGLHKDGYTFGWSSDARADAVDRNVARLQKNDTFIAMQQGGDKTWSMAVENGLYQVYVFAGDAAGARDRMGITVEDQLAVSGVTSKKSPYLDGTVTVNVTDGKLTIGNSGRAEDNKLDYVSIQSVESDPNLKTLDIDTAQPNADASTGTNGRFTVTRTGNLKHALTIPINVGGTAVNGTDYGIVADTLTFPAGVDTQDIVIRPAAVTGDKTVTLGIGATTGYTRVESSATVTIHGATAGSGGGTTTATNVSWTTKASRPVAASEIFGAAVGTKLYTFGGFVDNTYHPTTAAYAYDVHANTWSKLANLPVGLTHAGVTDDGSRYIYFAGGYPGNGSGGAQTFSTTAVYRYDTQTNTYTALKSLPQARGAGSLALVNGSLYFMGGDNSSRQDVTTMWALNLSNTAAGWVQKANVPASRNHAAAIGLGGYIYYLGGQTGQDAKLTTHADTYRYNPATETWTTLAAMPTMRSHITDATFVYGGKIVVLAGQSAYNTPISSVLEFDPTTDKWTNLASLPTKVFSGVGGYADGKFVYTAGYTSNFQKTTYIGTLS